MSYILDALRKSEARRRMGQAPGLDDTAPAASSGSRSGRIGRLALMGVAAVAIVGLAATVFLNRDLIGERMAGSDIQETSVPAAEQPIEPVLPLAIDEDETERGQARILQDRPYQVPSAERERVLSDPDEIEAELARRIADEEREESLARSEDESAEQDSRRVRTAPRTSVSAPAPRRRDQTTPEQVARAEEIERRLREIEDRHRREEQAAVARQEPDSVAESSEAVPEAASETADEPLEVAMVTPHQQAQPWRPGGAEYVRVWELPLSIRRSMPELKLTIHVYSREEQRRFVLVNGQRFTTGDTITGGVRLAEIRPEGAIIDYRDYRFLLEP